MVQEKRPLNEEILDGVCGGAAEETPMQLNTEDCGTAPLLTPQLDEPQLRQATGRH